MDEIAWRPSARWDRLRTRATLLAEVRRFFSDRGVVEVQTPLLASHTVSEPAVDSIPVVLAAQRFYLQTSPEYAMKRLLAAGAGDIYQLGSVFRAGEAGRRHNPEFTMLEWYRLGFDYLVLADEVVELITCLLQRDRATKHWTFDALLQTVGVNHARSASAEELLGVLRAHMDVGDELITDRGALLDLLYDLALNRVGAGIHVIRGFPVERAALAELQIDDDGVPFARRFEVVVDGLELANGYQELTDAREQTQRFLTDQLRRQSLGLPPVEIDPFLIAALEHGLPRCAGVALGFDRLLMLHADLKDIREVLAFPMDRI